MFAIYSITLLWLLMSHCESKNPGLQMRLTENGMKYAIDTGISILKEDLAKKVINENGRDGRLSWKVMNLRISNADFGSYNLFPVNNEGIRAKMTGIYLEASGNIWYRYKRGWVRISDTIGVKVKTKNVHANVELEVGADSNGRPTINLKSCSAGVDDINLDFHGGGSWIYNLVSSVIEKQLKKIFGKLLCNIVGEEIRTKAASELKTFPVIKAIDSNAKIDYSLTKPPMFTSKYMDVFIKAEFLGRNSAKMSSLPVPPITATDASSKMVYFWLTDFTMNTAGEVYHDAKVLKGHAEAWDPSVASEIKEFLNTKKFSIIIPQLYKKYGEAPMGVQFHSYSAPNIAINVNRLTINLFVDASFEVKNKDGNVDRLFDTQFQIMCTANVKAKEDNITAEILKFDYNAKVTKSYIGDISIPLDNFIFKTIIDMSVIAMSKPYLAKGFPLPKIDDVSFQNFDIVLQKDVIQVGTDVEYKKN